MQSLLYSAINRVRRVSKTIRFDDLVAVFTYSEAEGGLLVYHTDTAQAYHQISSALGGGQPHSLRCDRPIMLLMMAQ